MKKGIIFLGLLVCFAVILLINNGATETSSGTEATMQNFPQETKSSTEDKDMIIQNFPGTDNKRNGTNPQKIMIKKIPDAKWSVKIKDLYITGPQGKTFLPNGDIIVASKIVGNKNRIIKMDDKGNIISEVEILGKGGAVRHSPLGDITNELALSGEKIVLAGNGKYFMAKSNSMPNSNLTIEQLEERRKKTEEPCEGCLRNIVTYYTIDGKELWSKYSPDGKLYTAWVSYNGQTVVCEAEEAYMGKSELHLYDINGNLLRNIPCARVCAVSISKDGNYISVCMECLEGPPEYYEEKKLGLGKAYRGFSAYLYKIMIFDAKGNTRGEYEVKKSRDDSISSISVRIDESCKIIFVNYSTFGQPSEHFLALNTKGQKLWEKVFNNRFSVWPTEYGHLAVFTYDAGHEYIWGQGYKCAEMKMYNMLDGKEILNFKPLFPGIDQSIDSVETAYNDNLFIFVLRWTNKNNRDEYMLYAFNMYGELKPLKYFPISESPRFLKFSPDGKRLFMIFSAKDKKGIEAVDLEYENE